MQAEHLNQPISAHASREFTALPEQLTVGEALAHIRQRGASQQIVYFYVLDRAEKLVGVVPVRRLLTAPLEARLEQIMERRVVAIPATASVLEACEMFLLHRFLAFPVVDADGRLVGVVNVSLFTDEMLDLTERERTDELFETLGVRVAELREASPLRAFRLRVPWLTATMVGGLTCAVLASLHESTLAGSLVLAFFLTLVLGLGESVSTQSVSVTVQALRARRPDARWLARAVRREFATACLLGGTCGLTVGVLTWLWRGAAAPALVIGGGIAVSMVCACLIGVVVPGTLHWLRLDPKVAAGPLSLALADIVTLLVYFNLARSIL
ncbi:MAG: magnesium transporter [Verrucomicrobiae bacterium]|nr:magnesium transporter [Verrucomicrobiae bacterium]MDW8308770.1 magnesium transporter [Verrucomicrobiales bacterium]